jgi:hypothetical protein
MYLSFYYMLGYPTDLLRAPTSTRFGFTTAVLSFEFIATPRTVGRGFLLLKPALINETFWKALFEITPTEANMLGLKEISCPEQNINEQCKKNRLFE